MGAHTRVHTHRYTHAHPVRNFFGAKINITVDNVTVPFSTRALGMEQGPSEARAARELLADEWTVWAPDSTGEARFRCQGPTNCNTSLC